jgi:chromosome segregation ATPase
MLRENTNAGMLGQLVRFNAALAANSSELAHLEGMRLRFEKLVSEAQAIAQQQAALVASKQQASKRLQELLTEGLRSSTGLERLLQEFYGLRAEKLAEFGLQPFRGRRRKETPDDEPETPEPEAPGSTASPPEKSQD